MANARALANPAAPEIPDLIVVGIVTAANRGRDTTPPPTDDAFPPEATVGGAPRFAEFITSELLPWLATRYRVMPFTIVAGHSMTGLFAAYVYGAQPTKINAVLAISPSLGWNGGRAYGQVLAGLRARTAPGRFFAAASRDEDSFIYEGVRKLARDVGKGSKATTFQFRELAGDSHYNTPLQGTIDGLRFVFEPLSLVSLSIRTRIRFNPDRPEAAQAAGRHYLETRRLYLAKARALGFPERMPFQYGLGAANWMIDEPNLVAAVPVICEDLGAAYPDQRQGPECLGRALLKLGKLAEKAFQDAVTIARRSNRSAGVAQAEAGIQAVARARGS